MGVTRGAEARGEGGCGCGGGADVVVEGGGMVIVAGRCGEVPEAGEGCCCFEGSGGDVVG